jgi:hypothetical protein
MRRIFALDAWHSRPSKSSGGQPDRFQIFTLELFALVSGRHKGCVVGGVHGLVSKLWRRL